LSATGARAAAVPFFALGRDYETVREAVHERFERVLDSQVFVLGPQTAELELAIARLCGARHAVACSSGTDALYLALLACGIGTGDAVVVPAYTFFATAGAVRRAGALPVFADVDGDTFTLGERELDSVLERDFDWRDGGAFHMASGARLRALIVVHLFGRAAPTVALQRTLARAGAVLIEDCAQAIGAACDGVGVGAQGLLGCLSFYPTKNLGGAGDGGAVTTNDDELAASLRRLRTHGATPGETLHTECGVNARMDELQAAYLNAKLSRLAEWTAARARIAARYCERLRSLAEHGLLALPAPTAPPAHVWHQFVVRIAVGRERVRERLGACGIETRVFYPVPLHLQPCFADVPGLARSLPVAERLAREALSLPLYPALTSDQADAVCAELVAALGG
jgi:dTDP-4-amino-4,6-dideoxygalactose transaminase